MKLKEHYDNISWVFFSLSAVSIMIYLVNANGNGNWGLIEAVSFSFFLISFFLGVIYSYCGGNE